LVANNEPGAYPLVLQKGDEDVSERISAQASYHAYIGAQSGRGHSLIGALAAWEHPELSAD
jgi:hypothetical protein